MVVKSARHALVGGCVGKAQLLVLTSAAKVGIGRCLGGLRRPKGNVAPDAVIPDPP